MNASAIAVESPERLGAFTEDGCVHAPSYDRLLREAEQQLQVLLDDFSAAPSRAGLFEAGTVAEVVAVGQDLAAGRRLASLLGSAAKRWAERGILEELFFSESQLSYHSTLLLHLAGVVPLDVLQALSDKAMIGRSEWPVLTQLYISATLSQCGIASALPRSEMADLTARIDKRCLRATSNEYDLTLLLTAAQLMQLREVEQLRPLLPSGAPVILPRLLLTQALRANNWNWLPVLAFLCRRFFGMPADLERATRRALGEVAATPASFGPPAEGMKRETDFFSRSDRALRLRSAAALALFMDCTRE